MAAGTSNSNTTLDEVLIAAERLEPADADRVARRLLQLQARRRAASLPGREAELLEVVNRLKRPGFQQRYETLTDKLRSDSLSETEHDELLRLIDESEAFTAIRLDALAELARLRKVTLPTLMKRLGLTAPPVV